VTALKKYFLEELILKMLNLREEQVLEVAFALVVHQPMIMGK
jgi:hypothetical protein